MTTTTSRSWKRGTVLVAIALAVVASIGPIHSRAQTSIPWQGFHGDMQRSGVSGLPAPSSSLVGARCKWTGFGAFESSPVVDAGGTAYIGNNDGFVYAFNQSSCGGSKYLWKFETDPGAKPGQNKVISAPALDPSGGRVYVGSNNGTVYALKTADGTKIWSKDIGGAVYGSPVVSSDGSAVYVVSVTGNLYSLNGTNGSENWKKFLSQTVDGTMTLSTDGSTLFVPLYSSGFVAGLNATGSQAGSQNTAYFPSGGNVVAAPAVDANGSVYSTSTTGYVNAFTSGSQTPRWTYRLVDGQAIKTTPAVSQSIVVFGANNGNIYALNPQNGAPIWTRTTGGPVESSPAISTASNLVYVGSDDGFMYALRLSDGSVAWKKETGAPVTSPAIGPGNTLWYADSGGDIFLETDLPPPPTPGGTSAAGPTATPTATSIPTPTPLPSPGTTSVPAPTSTATSVTAGGSLSITIAKPQVSPGNKQTVKIKGPANTAVHMRVEYPNGDHQSKAVTTNAQGLATYQWTQAASKIFHDKFTAAVSAQIGSGTAKQTANGTYKVGFGKIDVMVEPRTAKSKQRVDLYVHTSPGKSVSVILLGPNGKFVERKGTTAKNGFAHFTWQVGTKLKTATVTKVSVKGQTLTGSPRLSTTTTLTINY